MTPLAEREEAEFPGDISVQAHTVHMWSSGLLTDLTPLHVAAGTKSNHGRETL